MKFYYKAVDGTGLRVTGTLESADADEPPRSRRGTRTLAPCLADAVEFEERAPIYSATAGDPVAARATGGST